MYSIIFMVVLEVFKMVSSTSFLQLLYIDIKKQIKLRLIIKIKKNLFYWELVKHILKIKFGNNFRIKLQNKVSLSRHSLWAILIIVLFNTLWGLCLKAIASNTRFLFLGIYFDSIFIITLKYTLHLKR